LRVPLTRLVPLEPRWWYPSTGALEMMVAEPTTTTEGLMVQTAPDQVPPEVPVKLPGIPPNKGGGHGWKLQKIPDHWVQ